MAKFDPAISHAIGEVLGKLLPEFEAAEAANPPPPPGPLPELSPAAENRLLAELESILR